MYKIFTDSLTGVVGGAIRNKTGHWKGKQFIIFVYYLVYVLFIILAMFRENIVILNQYTLL